MHPPVKFVQAALLTKSDMIIFLGHCTDKVSPKSPQSNIYVSSLYRLKILEAALFSDFL